LIGAAVSALDAPDVGLNTRNVHMHVCRCFETRGSLDRRVNRRRVPQPRWVGARRNAKGGRIAAGGRQAWEVEPAAFVLAPRLGRVRLQ
jgi:hypothetical protein